MLIMSATPQSDVIHEIHQWFTMWGNYNWTYQAEMYSAIEKIRENPKLMVIDLFHSLFDSCSRFLTLEKDWTCYFA